MLWSSDSQFQADETWLLFSFFVYKSSVELASFVVRFYGSVTSNCRCWRFTQWNGGYLWYSLMFFFYIWWCHFLYLLMLLINRKIIHAFVWSRGNISTSPRTLLGPPKLHIHEAISDFEKYREWAFSVERDLSWFSRMTKVQSQRFSSLSHSPSPLPTIPSIALLSLHP